MSCMGLKTAVALLCCAFCMCARAAEGTTPQCVTLEKGTTSSIRPSFSWDTVPQWLIVRKATAFTGEEIRLIAKAPLVVFEKENGFRDADSVEDGILRAARAVKVENPKLITLFYWNAVIHYGHYRANETFSKNLENWALKKDGETFLFKNRFPIYNLVERGWQDWWINTAKGMALDPAIDGVMIDAICKTGGADDGRRALYPEAQYGRAYFQTGSRLKGEIGGKLLIGNAIRASEPQCNLQHLKYLDGSYVERWAVPARDRDFVEYVANGMQAMSQALSKGKLILFNSSPEVLRGEAEFPPPDASYPEKEHWMREHIRFPLAVFLMIAEEGAYFHWGTGPDALPGPAMDVWRNDIYQELSRPLGKPSGPATRQGDVFSRSFEHLDLWVNLKTREAKLNWKQSTDSADFHRRARLLWHVVPNQEKQNRTAAEFILTFLK